MKKFLTLVLLGITYLMLANCSKRQAAEMKPDEKVPETPAANITYANFAQALFQTKCNGCHGTGGPAAGIWTFNGHSSIVSNADNIRRVLLVSKTMPKGGSLSASELSSLQTWFTNGLPQ